MPDRSRERRANGRVTQVLRAVFLAGAVTDAGALLPMLLPSFATLLRGLRDVSDSYQLAMRGAASLMFGWTLLLVWASRRPLGCGVPTVPILVWNVVCTRFLPPALASNEFSRNIPPLVTYGENTLRIVVMVLPFLMPLDVATGGQRRGLLLFTVGTVFYVLAWVPLMIAPQSGWSTSWLGFVAPAYTPIVWLTGLGLVGRRLYVRSSYRQWMYVALACGFVAFHVTHTSIVYARNYPHQAATRGEGR